MTKLFDNKDLLTIATAEQAVIGAKGYFGDNLSTLIDKIRQGKVETLLDVISNVTYCFRSNSELHYTFFLPADKVNKPAKKKAYREIRDIDDLLNLLQPFVLSDVTEKQKIDAVLGKRIEIMHVTQNHSCHVIIQSIGYNEVLRKMTVNNIDTLTLWNYYKIKLEGKWRPFAVEYETEEQDSERSKDKDVDNSLSDYMDKRIKEISEEE